MTGFDTLTALAAFPFGVAFGTILAAAVAYLIDRTHR